MKILSPTLIIDIAICKNNIKEMAEKSRKSGCLFRPHFKTHQSAEIGQWFKDEGVDKICVSSVKMAQQFAEAGWDDILIAFPANVLEIERINDLAAKIKLSLTVEDMSVVSVLGKSLKNKVDLYLKIDTGYQRTGLLSEDTEQMEQIIQEIKNNNILDLKGLLTHAGHTYHAKSRDEITQIYNSSTEQLKILKERFSSHYPDLIISYGDTPSCSLTQSFEGIDEARPGNFVFYDLMQWQLGVCTIKDIAVAVICPVVALHPKRNEIVFHGGAVHLSKEYLIDENGEKFYGNVAFFENGTWKEPIPDTSVVSLSQEHGIINSKAEYFSSFKIGSLVAIIPVHSCLTANLYDSYLTTNGSTIDKFRS